VISPDTLLELTRSQEQRCLTLYFNTGPDLPRATYPARFRSLVRGIDPSISVEDRKQFEAVTARVFNFLGQYQPAGNSIIIYATEKTWQEHLSRVPVRDEVFWGRPDVNQLLWLLEEYRPYGVLIADKEHVRFLAVRLNEFEHFKEFSTDIDTSDWRKQVIGSVSRGGAVQKGGANVQAFDNRYMEQVHRFWRSLHRPIADLVTRHHIRRIVLAANKSLLPEFARSLPANLANAVVTQVAMDGFTTPTDAVKRIYPEIESWEEGRDRKTVGELLNAAGIGQKAAVGIDAVLKHIQDGRAARLVVAKGLDREVSRCAVCGTIIASGSGPCSYCSASDVRKAGLASNLARLAVRYSLPVEIVKRGPGEELSRNGGIGAFLRF